MDPTLDDERIDSLRRVRRSMLWTAGQGTGPRPDMRWVLNGLRSTLQTLTVARTAVAGAGRDDDVASLDSIRTEVEALLPYADPEQGATYRESAKSIAASCFELAGRISELGGYYPV